MAFSYTKNVSWRKNSPAVSPLGRAAVKYSLKYISALPCDVGEDAIFYSSTFFFRIPRIKQPTTAPITTAARYITGLPMVGSTNNPP